jgi:molybdopterin-containing oxidoreductase family iron-sulfur binding subunit
MKKDDATGFTYWRSLDELERTPEFQEAVQREFPDDEWDRLPPATRRQFLQVMGASMALAGLTACRWPEEKIVPFAHRPDGRVPGVPEQYATSFELAGAAVGMLVTSFDGRPVKVEGNPLHPDSLGAASAAAQAEVLQLYDPDRSRRVLYREAGQDYVRQWSDFDQAVAASTAPGQRLAVLAGASSSVTRRRLRDRLLAERPDVRWFEYEPCSRDNERAGTSMVYGRPVRPQPKLEQAAVVACFDADPLFDHPSALRLAHDFAAARDPEHGAGARLYVAEGGFSLTGVRADHRLAVAPSQIPLLMAGLANRLVAEHGLELPAAAAGFAGALGGDTPEMNGFAALLAEDLMAHRGTSLVLVGARQAPAVHALAAVLNEALAGVGRTIAYTDVADPERPSHFEAIADLAAAVRLGEVETLLILGGNPAYDAPSDLDFAELLASVPVSIHVSLYDDETSQRCSWHVPAAHALEAWGDGLAWDGTVTLRQPLIAPLYEGRSDLEILALLLDGGPASGHDLVRETLAARATSGDFERFWQQSLHDGTVADSAAPTVAPRTDPSALASAVDGLRAELDAEPPTADRKELVLTADPSVYDGRFANNGWLQEVPDPLTKIAWDNVLVVPPPTAREMGVEDGDVVEVSAGGRSVELPVWIQPGQAANVLSTTLGYGRTAAGQVGNGVGVDTYALRTSDSPSILRGVSVRPTDRRYALASTQDHFAIDTLGFEARNVRVGTMVRETTVETYRANPNVIHEHDHHPPNINLWKDHVYEGEQWGMSIDLNTCIGCNACVVACQAENNIPVVGKEQVLMQREMHWLRIDRYFKTETGVAASEVESAEVVFQPVTCVHCENAPCEQVCPVAATQHTRDGLNAMSYNRCVGTRYCSNNCPFKVRRFNFFNYHKNLDEIEKMQFNPEVTVRARGVMEKCTFCVQRIESVRITARNDRRPIADGEIVPACAQTCPSKAITFGNLNDPSSKVSKRHEEHRAYATLAELNIRPRALYLARLSNPAGDDGAAHAPPHDAETSHGKESA